WRCSSRRRSRCSVPAPRPRSPRAIWRERMHAPQCNGNIPTISIRSEIASICTRRQTTERIAKLCSPWWCSRFDSTCVTARFEQPLPHNLRENFSMDATETADAQDAAANVADDFAEWREELAKVEGVLVGRERRVSVAEVLALLDLGDLTGSD